MALVSLKALMGVEVFVGLEVVGYDDEGRAKKRAKSRTVRAGEIFEIAEEHVADLIANKAAARIGSPADHEAEARETAMARPVVSSFDDFGDRI